MPKNMQRPLGAGECFDRLNQLMERAAARRAEKHAKVDLEVDNWVDAERERFVARCTDPDALRRMIDATKGTSS